MPEQYFANDPACESKPAEASFSYRGQAMRLTTDAGVFSRGELDAGTRVLLDALPYPLEGRVLDMGCGWGAVGVCLGAANPRARMAFCDINSRALALARQNAARYAVSGDFYLSDGLQSVEGRFDLIALNPPIRAGKDTVYRLFADAAARLNAGGALYVVIRKRQGAESALRRLQTLFADVAVIDKSGGYWVIRCMGGNQNAL